MNERSSRRVLRGALSFFIDHISRAWFGGAVVALVATTGVACGEAR